MPAQNLRLSDRQLKGVTLASKDYVLTGGDGLQLRVRSNGSLLWNFNYREPVTKKRINIGFAELVTELVNPLLQLLIVANDETYEGQALAA